MDALKARRIQQGMSQIALEDRAGLTGGYVGKIEGSADKKNNRAIGRESLPLLLGALKLELAVVPVEKQASSKHALKALPRKLLTGDELKKFLENRARKGGRIRKVRLTKKQRRDIAMNAAKARWEKHRAGQKRQSKGKPEPIIVPASALQGAE
ncbi:hypothetical protein [Microvirga sp. KLBC 81]|uniref:hypothetical protein n=1 Tax=Microvirga sp. KLBC 81 TaxID=1862707 RepID=UPI001057C8E9|nr:hypothetical protein [Microvirga sp. KLBC 81]